MLAAAVESAYQEAIARWNVSLHGPLFPEHDRPVRRRQLELLLEYVPPDGLIVDVGTGTGIVPLSLLAAGRRVFAVDRPGGGAEVAEWIRERGGETAYATVGPEAIPLDAGSADAVLLADVIEHLPGSPLPLLGEIRRVLKPGGWLVLTTPNATRIHARLKLLAGRSVWPPLAVVLGEDAIHASHHREYTRGDVAEVLKLAGFDGASVEMVEERLLRLPLVGRAASRMLAASAPWLAGDIVAVSRRRSARPPET